MFRALALGARGRELKSRHSDHVYLTSVRFINTIRIMPLKNIEDRRRYQREWQAKRRSDWIDSRGPCAVCGSNENLEVDHINPATKLDHRVWNWAEPRRLKELAKCQILCSDHHKEKTAKYRALVLKHGTASMYSRGCRCDSCRVSTSAAKAFWRKNTGRH